MQGRLAEAFEEYLFAQCASPDARFIEVQCAERSRAAFRKTGWAGVHSGSKKSLLSYLDRIPERSARKASWYSSLALISLYEGDTGKAMDYLEKSLDEKKPYEIMNFSFPFLNVDPQYDLLHDEPRFRQLIAKIGLRS